MSWLSGLAATSSPTSAAILPDLGLGQVAEREAQELQLLRRRPVKEVALVARCVGALVQLNAAVAHDTAHIMAGRKAVRAELARERDEVGELHALVAQAQGIGVRPCAYSSTNLSITPVRKRLS